MNITNIKANDAIVYSGNVHIQYKFNKKTKHIRKHNTGKLALFTSIVLALGERIEDAAAFMPRYITAKDAEEADCLTSKVVLQNRSYFKQQADGTMLPCLPNEADTLRYTFVIPVGVLISGKNIKKLLLVNTRNAACAEIDLGDVTISTNVNANLLIYWDLTFADAATA